MNVYTVYDLSEMLLISEKTIRKYLKKGKLKGAKVARKWLVHEDAVKEFLGLKKQLYNMTQSNLSKDGA